jgi:transposase
MNNKGNGQKRSRRKYDEEFKEGAVKMVEAGQSARSVAESLGVRVEHVYRWKAAKQAGANDAERELVELRAKYRQLEQERDILKKALSIFSRGG